MELNIEKWYKEKYKTKVKNETEFYVNAFSIIWGLYESNIYDNEFGVAKYKEERDRVLKKIENNQELMNIVLDFVEVIKKYCSERHGGDINQIYKNFLFDNKVKNTQFKASDLDVFYSSDKLGDKIYLLITLLGRVRNNFLHGEKEIYDLDNQINLFKVLEEFMIFSLSL